MSCTAAKLAAKLDAYGRIAIAFSGGCDSSLLAEAARRTLGNGRVLLLLAASPLLPRAERDRAGEFAAAGNFQLEEVELEPLAVPEVAANAPDRCYHCKKRLFTALQERARAHGFGLLADGTNADDIGDYRPGLRAADQLGVAHPFLELNISKPEIRRLAREYGLAIWDLPAAACLASRIPTGTPLTLTALRQVEQAEAAVTALGFCGVRVRHLGMAARLELPPEQLEPARARLAELARVLRENGFADFELAPYRMGSMNRLS